MSIWKCRIKTLKKDSYNKCDKLKPKYSTDKIIIKKCLCGINKCRLQSQTNSICQFFCWWKGNGSFVSLQFEFTQFYRHMDFFHLKMLQNFWSNCSDKQKLETFRLVSTPDVQLHMNKIIIFIVIVKKKHV